MKMVTQITTINFGLAIFPVHYIRECMICSTFCHPCKIQNKPIYTF